MGRKNLHGRNAARRRRNTAKRRRNAAIRRRKADIRRRNAARRRRTNAAKHRTGATMSPADRLEVVLEPNLAGVDLIGTENRSCSTMYFSKDFVKASELPLFETELLAKEFRDEKVFIRFTVDDAQTAWSCLKTLPHWLPPNGACVLVSGVRGTQGVKFKTENDTYEITQLSEGQKELEIKVNLFEKERERLIKGKVIENDTKASGKHVVEIEFQQMMDENFDPEAFFWGSNYHLLLLPCYWPILVILVPSFLGLAVLLLIVNVISSLMGFEKKPAGKHLSHPESLQLRAKFQIFGSTKKPDSGLDGLVPFYSTPEIPETVDIEKGIMVDDNLGMTTSVLPPGFGS